MIDDQLVPDGVALQVLTQAREHLIRRSFGLQGAQKAIVHVSIHLPYSAGNIWYEQEEIKNIAVEGVRLVKKLLQLNTEVQLVFP